MSIMKRRSFKAEDKMNNIKAGDIFEYKETGELCVIINTDQKNRVCYFVRSGGYYEQTQSKIFIYSFNYFLDYPGHWKIN